MDGLVDANLITRHEPFAESRGNVILVRKGNPKDIASISDLLSDDVTVACSNPKTEKASYAVYAEMARGLAREAGADGDAVVAKLSTVGPKTVHSKIIHHREVPELIGAGQADAAIIYYHLALRYTRIFPDIFELVDIGGVLSGERTPQPGTTSGSSRMVASGVSISFLSCKAIRCNAYTRSMGFFVCVETITIIHLRAAFDRKWLVANLAHADKGVINIPIEELQ